MPPPQERRGQEPGQVGEDVAQLAGHVGRRRPSRGRGCGGWARRGVGSGHRGAPRTSAVISSSTPRARRCARRTNGPDPRDLRPFGSGGPTALPRPVRPGHPRLMTITPARLLTRFAVIGLETVAAVSAVGGGIGLIAGNAIGMPADWLAATPFSSWRVPGVLLLLVVAVPMGVAAVAELRRSSLAPLLSLIAG